jgi:hypothetical protein
VGTLDFCILKELALVNRISRIELGTAVASVALALIAGIYLSFTTFAESEACYGISHRKIVCHPLAPNSVEAAQTATRLAVSLSIVLVLYIGGALAARWQTRTQQADARVTAYMALVTCAVTVLAFTLPAIGGVGFFFVPATLLLVAAAVCGLFALLRARREKA